jgi:hypothetical protein
MYFWLSSLILVWAVFDRESSLTSHQTYVRLKSSKTYIGFHFSTQSTQGSLSTQKLSDINRLQHGLSFARWSNERQGSDITTLAQSRLFFAALDILMTTTTLSHDEI